jgi:hypothetical protein
VVGRRHIPVHCVEPCVRSKPSATDPAVVHGRSRVRGRSHSYSHSGPYCVADEGANAQPDVRAHLRANQCAYDAQPDQRAYRRTDCYAFHLSHVCPDGLPGRRADVGAHLSPLHRRNEPV